MFGCVSLLCVYSFVFVVFCCCFVLGCVDLVLLIVIVVCLFVMCFGVCLRFGV